MGAKKQAEKSKKMWTKVLAIVAGVFFVIVMVLSAMGSSWISSLATIKPGDSVTIDYTIYNVAGRPVVTTNQQIYTGSVNNNTGILATKQLTLVANQSLSQVYPITVYPSTGGGTQQFVLFASEFDAISSGLVGMRVNDKKVITLPSDNLKIQQMTVHDIEASGMNISRINVGDGLYLGVSSVPVSNLTNSSVYYIRDADVTSKTDSGIVVDLNYPRIDVTVDSINKAST
ncbi:MAG: hypothetical protein ABSG28_04200 [Methanoregula sp.]|jgi:hypothetical protein|uniref:hypothetical protein n=1 Tax=Methanoregula sp. TaxID=2052170 RepID=UPI003C1CF4F5